MNTPTRRQGVLLGLGLISWAFPALLVHAAISPVKTSTAEMAIGTTTLSAQNIRQVVVQDQALETWIRAMARCESSNNPRALNKADLDGTPSYGLFQFKPSTFRHYIQKYDLFDAEEWDSKAWKEALWNGEYQEMIFRAMIRDEGVNFRKEFPGCTRRLGLPPVVKNTAQFVLAP